MIKALVAIALAAWLGLAGAQSFPTRPVTLISPFPPGGSTDIVARIVAAELTTPRSGPASAR